MLKKHFFFSGADSLDPHTSLHQFLDKEKVTNEELKSFIMTLGEEKASRMSRTIDNNGHLPIDLIKTNNQKQKNQLRDILIPLMTRFSFKSLSTMVDSKEFDAYTPSVRLYKNLQSASLAINKVRLIIDKSETHPQTNCYTKQDKEKLRNMTLALAEIKRDRIKKISRDYYIHQPIETRIKIVACIATLYTEAKVGNCDAVSFIALNHLIRLNYLYSIEVFQLIGGDHIFLVLDRNVESTPEDFASWGENAVICDPWSGETYPASEILSKLHNFEHYKTSDDSYVNVVTSFNPKAHQLSACFAVQLPLPIAHAQLEPITPKLAIK